MGLISWLASVMILAALAVHAEEGPHRFSVDLPTGWQQASHVRLVLEGLTVAGGQPFKLRAAAIIEGADPVMLGSDRCDAPPRLVGRPPGHATSHHDPHRSGRWPQCADGRARLVGAISPAGKRRAQLAELSPHRLRAG